jgi:Luciferase-like monooxygenase
MRPVRSARAVDFTLPMKRVRDAATVISASASPCLNSYISVHASLRDRRCQERTIIAQEGEYTAMDFGIICLASVEARKDVAFAEASGFTHAWIADSQMVWADAYKCLALCANDTRKIKLGTNVTNPSSRIAPVTACNFATLNVLAPGRVIMGIGTGAGSGIGPLFPIRKATGAGRSGFWTLTPASSTCGTGSRFTLLAAGPNRWSWPGKLATA